MCLLSGWSNRLGASNGDFHFLFYNFFKNCSSFELQISMKSLDLGAWPGSSPTPAAGLQAGRGALLTPPPQQELSGAEGPALVSPLLLPLPPLPSRKWWVSDVTHSH